MPPATMCAACANAILAEYDKLYPHEGGMLFLNALPAWKKCAVPLTKAQKQAIADRREHERTRWEQGQAERDRASHEWQVQMDAQRAIEAGEARKAAAAAAAKELQGPTPAEVAEAVKSVSDNKHSYAALGMALKITSAAFEVASDELKKNYAIKIQLEAIKKKERQRNRTKANTAATLP